MSTKSGKKKEYNIFSLLQTIRMERPKHFRDISVQIASDDPLTNLKKLSLMITGEKSSFLGSQTVQRFGQKQIY